MESRDVVSHLQQDPWRASAVVSAFTQLIISLIFLLHTVFMCLSFQLLKWCGWVLPSEVFPRSQNSIVPSHYDVYACKNSIKLDKDKQLKQIRSNDRKQIICPKCCSDWNFNSYSPVNNRGSSSMDWGKTSISHDNCASCSTGHSYVHPGDNSLRNMAYDPKSKYRNVSKLASSCSFPEKSTTCNESLHRAQNYVAIFETAKVNNYVEVVEENKRYTTEEIDTMLAKDEMKDLCAGWDAYCKSSLLAGTVSPEIESGEIGLFHDENLKMINDSETGQNAIRTLREALRIERQKLCALYQELEVERIASETAANETLSKILHLQEEKAALQMQAAHFQRMAEEKAKYDEQAMQILKDILYKKEKENYLLEMEIQLIRKSSLGEAKEASKRRMECETLMYSVNNMPKLLHREQDAVVIVEGQSRKTSAQHTGGNVKTGSSIGLESISEGDTVDHRKTLSTSISRVAEEHPFKRRKSLLMHDNSSLDMWHEPHLSFTKYHDDTQSIYSSSLRCKKFDEDAETQFGISEGDAEFDLAVTKVYLDKQMQQHEMNREESNHFCGEILANALRMADNMEKSSIGSMNSATRKDCRLDIHQYKVENVDFCGQHSDEADSFCLHEVNASDCSEDFGYTGPNIFLDKTSVNNLNQYS